MSQSNQTNELLVWAAGLFDGEGSIYCGDARQSHLLNVGLSMTHKETVFRFREAVQLGAIHFSPARNLKHKGIWCFKANNEDAADVAIKLLPYLFTKRRQAELALEYKEKCIFVRKGGNVRIPEHVLLARQIIYDELKELNKRGPT